MDPPDGDVDSRAMEEGKGKELEHADSSEVEQQATAYSCKHIHRVRQPQFSSVHFDLITQEMLHLQLIGGFHAGPGPH